MKSGIAQSDYYREVKECMEAKVRGEGAARSLRRTIFLKRSLRS
jgi:hypothetical protein